MDTSIELWEQEIAEANKFHFFEEANNQLDFLFESVSLDSKLIEEGYLTEDAEVIIETIKQKVESFLAKVISVVVKLIAGIVDFIRTRIKNGKIKKLERKLDSIKGNVKPEKLDSILNKASFFDPKLVKEKLEKSGLFDFMQSSLEDLVYTAQGKTVANFAEAVPAALAVFAGKETKYKFSNGAGIKELEDLAKDTNDNIVMLNTYIKSYEGYLKRAKNDIKKVGKKSDADKYQLMQLKSFMQITKGCIKALQKSVKEHIQQTMAIYKAMLSIIRITAQDANIDPEDFIDDFDDWDFDDDDLFEDIDDAES